jgi:acetylornithine deacetylase/succinyl-diaminopimelate desuccinylase-like protein
MSMEMKKAELVDWEALAQEATTHLQALLRYDTTESETEAILYLRDQLAAEGVETQIFEPAPGRQSLWAKLSGNGNKRALLLLSHVDVVPVERARWTVDPFGGEIRDGYVYGRGAVDMKSMTAKQLALFLHFARQQKAGTFLDRDLVLLAVADEERSSRLGMEWIVKERPDLVKDAEYSLNEGGGFALELGGKRVYVCETAQKGRLELALRASGKPGHASVPHQENALLQLCRAVGRAGRGLPMHVTPTMRRFLSVLASTQEQPRRALLPLLQNPLLSEQILKAFPGSTADPLRAMLHNTVTPTMFHAGQASNVIPSQVVATLDGRLLPGQTPESFLQEVRQQLADSSIQIEAQVIAKGHEQTSETPLFAAIEKAVGQHDPGAVVAPYLFPGLTDSRFLVPLGVCAYGFDPMQPESGWPSPQTLAHGHDERISLANIGFGLRVLSDVIQALCA